MCRPDPPTACPPDRRSRPGPQRTRNQRRPPPPRQPPPSVASGHCPRTAQPPGRCSDGARTFRTRPDHRDRFGTRAHRRPAAARGTDGHTAWTSAYAERPERIARHTTVRRTASSPVVTAGGLRMLSRTRTTAMVTSSASVSFGVISTDRRGLASSGRLFRSSSTLTYSAIARVSRSACTWPPWSSLLSKVDHGGPCLFPQPRLGTTRL